MRSKNNNKSRKKKKVLKNHYFGLTGSSFKKSRIRMYHAVTKSVIDRHKKKRLLKQKNIVKINAFLNNKGLKYSRFINLLKINKLLLNKSMILKICYNEILFNKLLDLCKKKKIKSC